MDLKISSTGSPQVPVTLDDSNGTSYDCRHLHVLQQQIQPLVKYQLLDAIVQTYTLNDICIVILTNVRAATLRGLLQLGGLHLKV